VHRGPLEDDSLSEKHPTNLRLALLWQDTVVTEKVLKKGQVATIGEDLSNTIVLPDIAGIGTKYPLFTPTPSGYVLNLTPQMKGRMRHDADEKSVEDVRKSKGDKVSVDYHDWGLLELGQLQIFFGFVSESEEIPAPPLFQRFETGTLSALLLAYVMQVGPLIAAFWLWDDKPNLHDLEQRDRVVGYVFEKPPEEIEEEKEEKQEDVGKKAGGEEGKFGEEDKKEKTKVPLQDGQMVDKVKNMALTKALTSNLMGKGPLQNVFSDKTAFASKLNAAMSGEGSELVMGHGYGGMGMRGMGTGGGGEGFGRIHGMGRIDTGGGRGTKASLGGKAQRKASPRVQRGAGDVQGFCKESDIQKVVAARQAGITYCYEKELARDPELQGKVTVNWRIGTDGKVMKVIVENSTLGNKDVEACMMRNIERWQFPKPEGGMCQIRYPFVFNAGL
jgi:TonB family protein